MASGAEQNEPAGRDVDPGDDATAGGVFAAVRDGYEAVYRALPRGRTFNRIWRDNACRGEFPAEFAHIGFLTLSEAERMLDLLQVPVDGVLVDLACGAGGPGLWAAQQAGASLVGVDPAAPGLDAARRRAEAVGMATLAEFKIGTFEQTGLPDGIADAVMSIEAFQYAPNKRAALTEFARVVKRGGRIAVVCFEVDPAKVAGLPVLGVDPVIDYVPLFEAAGFVVRTFEETPGWADRVYPTFEAVVGAADELRAEMGERAAGAVLSEAMLTLATRPYPRRVLIVAERS